MYIAWSFAGIGEESGVFTGRSGCSDGVLTCLGIERVLISLENSEILGEKMTVSVLKNRVRRPVLLLITCRSL